MGQKTEKLSFMVEPFVITFSCFGMSVPLTNFQALTTSATDDMDKGTVCIKFCTVLNYIR